MTKKNVTYVLLTAAAGIIVFSTLVFRNRPREVTKQEAIPNEMSAHPPIGDSPSKNNVNQTYVSRVEDLKKSIEANPRNVYHLAVLARLLMDGHQAADAIPYFERAVRIQPKNDSLLLDLSVCYSIVKNYDASLTVTGRLLSQDPANLTALYNQGALLATLGKSDEAARSWKKILTLAPHSDEAKKATSGLTAIGR